MPRKPGYSATTINNHQRLVRASLRAVAALQGACERFHVMFDAGQATSPDKEAYYAMVTALRELAAVHQGQAVRTEKVVLAVRGGKAYIEVKTDFVDVTIKNEGE